MLGRPTLVSSQASSRAMPIISTSSMISQAPQCLTATTEATKGDAGRRCQDLKVLGRRPGSFRVRPDPEGEWCWQHGFHSSLLHEREGNVSSTFFKSSRELWRHAHVYAPNTQQPAVNVKLRGLQQRRGEASRLSFLCPAEESSHVVGRLWVRAPRGFTGWDETHWCDPKIGDPQDAQTGRLTERSTKWLSEIKQQEVWAVGEEIWRNSEKTRKWDACQTLEGVSRGFDSER